MYIYMCLDVRVRCFISWPPFYLFLLFCLPYVYWSACMSVHHIHAWCLRKPEEGVRFSQAGVAEGYVMRSGYWDLNLHPLEEQPWLLTAELSLWLAFIYFQTGVSLAWNLPVTSLASHWGLGIYLMLYSPLPTFSGLVDHYSWPIRTSVQVFTPCVADGLSTEPFSQLWLSKFNLIKLWSSSQ